MTDPAQGVFETMLVRDGRIQALDAHLHRLHASTTALYDIAPAPALPAEARARARPLHGDHRLRIDAVPASAGLTLALTTSPLDAGRPTTYACAPLTLPGGQGPHKFIDRAAIEHATAQTPLLVDGDGAVLEAAWANVWLLDGATLITPPTDGRILPGVTRARLLTLAPQLGLTAIERPIALRDARRAPILMLTSSLRLAVTARLDGAPPQPHPRVEAIRSALSGGDWDDPPPPRSC